MGKLLQKVVGSTVKCTLRRSPTLGLGIVMKEAFLEFANDEKFPVIIVTDLKPGGPAEEAGVLVGDVVVLVGDENPQEVTTFEQFGGAVRGKDTVVISVLRGTGQGRRDGKETGQAQVPGTEDEEEEEDDDDKEQQGGDNAPQQGEEDGEHGEGEVQEEEEDEEVEEEDEGYVEDEDLMEEEEEDEDEEEDDDMEERKVPQQEQEESEEDEEGGDYVEGSYEFEEETMTVSSTENSVEPSPPLQAPQKISAKTQADAGASVEPKRQPVAQVSPAKPPQRTRATIDLKGDEPLEIVWKGTKEIAAGSEFAVPINISFPFAHLTWSFIVESADVEFSILPVQGKSKGTTPSVAPSRMSCKVSGTKKLPLRGELSFAKPVMMRVCWSNAYSWMTSKKVTYTVRVDDKFLREKKRAVTSAIRKLFAETVQQMSDEDAAIQREVFSHAVAQMPTQLSTFNKLKDVKVHAMQRIKFEVEAKLAALSTEARALRQVASNTQLAYQQDIDRINALIKKSSGDKNNSANAAAAKDGGASKGGTANGAEEETVEAIANRIELDVFLDAYKNAFAHLERREKALRARHAAVDKEHQVISTALEQLMITANLEGLSKQISP